MCAKTLMMKDGRLGELMAAFPLAPIEDEHSYSRAIEILDRLFLLNREKNRDESDYFRALAEIACQYESRS
jgi:antitoxin component HigA of HigAB toxin-antitoxin module